MPNSVKAYICLNMYSLHSWIISIIANWGWGPWKIQYSSQFSSVRSLSRVRLFATPWIAARQASLSITNSQSSLRLTHSLVHRVSDAIQPSHTLSSPSPPAPNPSQHQSFPVSQLLAWGGQSTGVSALASFLPKKFQGWSPSEWTHWISVHASST